MARVFWKHYFGRSASSYWLTLLMRCSRSRFCSCRARGMAEDEDGEEVKGEVDDDELL